MTIEDAVKVAVTGLKAQSGRMRVIAENLANANSTSNTPGADPYRRRIATFQTVYDRELGAQVVKLGRVALDGGQFQSRYEPNHPAANEKGYVLYPNVNSLVETMDMREAQRAYEAGLNVIRSARAIVQGTLGILRG